MYLIKNDTLNFKQSLFICLVAGSLFSCHNKSTLNVPSENIIAQNILPIVLQPKETTIPVSDIFIDESQLDSASARPYFKIELSKDKKHLTIKEATDQLPPLSFLTLYSGNYQYSILLKKSLKVSQEFTFTALGQMPQKVQLAGDFNGWSPSATELILNENVFSTKLNLSPGKYAYQLVVDDKWMLDPANKNKVDNNIGGINSVVTIPGYVQEKAPKLITEWADGNIIRIKTSNNPEKFFVLWNNFNLTELFTTFNDDVLEIKIPDAAAQSPKSIIRVWSYNSQGVSNDVFIPLKYGIVVKQTKDINRFDNMAMIMYFMMVDRFYDGDKSNNHPINDPEVLPMANYLGGDIEGINQKIKEGYFNQLGVNTIWMSPIVQNPYEAYTEYPAPHRKYSGYHGYWPISSTQIDTRFGTSATLSKTIQLAHNRDMNILLDYVSNHIHEKHPINTLHKDWITPIDLPDGRKNIRIWDEQRLTTWFDTFLPDLDYTKPEVVDAMTDSAMYWLQKYHIDGFRHDATKHVSEDFWRALTIKIKRYAAQQKQALPYQIGETFGSRELIGSYVNSGEQDAQFDFNLYFDARSVFANDNEPFTKLSESLTESFNYYGWHSLMGNISGNHDIARFISYAGEDLKFNEDDKEAGWKRVITVKNKVGYKKLAQLMAFNATIPGVPVIYYGDEIGMAGAGDPDNRRMMKFDQLLPEQANQLEITRKIFQIRKNNIALIYGDFDWLKTDKDVMAYARYYFGNAAFVFFNKGNKTIKFSVHVPKVYASANLSKNFNGKFTMQDGKMIVELPPHSFELITTK